MGYEFFGEKIIFPSAPVTGINNDQSLTLSMFSRDPRMDICKSFAFPS